MTTPRSITDYLTLFRAPGARFAAHSIEPAVLVVQRVAPPPDDGEEAEARFHTKLLARVPVAELEERSAEAGFAVPGQVVRIAKREGGAFPDRFGLGRAPNADVRVPLSLVSKYHAFFARDPDGAWSITDAGSRNGTFVDDRQLAPKVATRIDDGTIIGIGPHRLVFHTANGFMNLLRRRSTAS